MTGRVHAISCGRTGLDLLDPAAVVELAADPAAVLAWLDAIRPAWHRHAACARPEHRHVDFHPAGRGQDPAPALAVCRACPVLDECRADVDRHEQGRRASGVWAGEAPAERRARRARRQAQQAKIAGPRGTG